jgi:hypothetical protein
LTGLSPTGYNPYIARRDPSEVIPCETKGGPGGLRHEGAAMIIWGWRGREIQIGSGRFNCPQCDGERSYEQTEVATYFTLYFIPIFRTQTHGQFVKCRTCSQVYRPEILDYKPPTAGERLLLAVRGDLEGGMPVHMARQKLVGGGIEQELAEKVVTQAAGEQLLRCAQCGFDYAESIKQCSNCGGTLGPSQLAG